jgi:transposase InsO family protein
MCHRDRRRPNPARSPQRYLRLSRRAKGPSRKGDLSRFLLARNDLRRKSGHKVLRSLPEIFSSIRQPFAIHETNRPHMASPALGPRHCRAPAHGSGEPQVHLRRYRVFYQMDRGEGCIHNITSKTAHKFFWQNIVCRFGVPSELIVDNGKQFDSQDFKDFCFSIGTKLAFASVYHSQSNGVVERANGKIFTAVKKMLLDEKRASGPICYLKCSGR